jgi:hypothetical protein
VNALTLATRGWIAPAGAAGGGATVYVKQSIGRLRGRLRAAVGRMVGRIRRG